MFIFFWQNNLNIIQSGQFGLFLHVGRAWDSFSAGPTLEEELLKIFQKQKRFESDLDLTTHR